MFAAPARTALRRCAASALAQTTTMGRALSCAATTAPFFVGGAASSTRITAVAAVSALRHTSFGFHSTVAAPTEEVPIEEKDLAQVLQAELDHERDDYAPSETVKNGPPAPWTSGGDDDGDCEITLTRTFGDDEQISVNFNVAEDRYDEEEDDLSMSEEEEEEEEEEEAEIGFTVSVSRTGGKASLEFACATDGHTVEVRNVRYDAVDPDDDEYALSSYPGPKYDELDESVQEEFHKYLEARGIDEAFVKYVYEVREDKEQKEYMAWLHNVANFVAVKKP